MRVRLTIMLLALAFTGAAVAPARDLPEGTLAVANMGDDSVWLIDLPSGERRARIETRIAPHEVAVSRDGRQAAVTNYGDERGPGNLIQLVDVVEGAVLRELVLDGFERIHGAAFLEGDSLLAVTSERTGEVLVVDGRDGRLVRRLETRGRASHMLSLGGEWLYTANIMDGTVSRIDPAGTRKTLVWPAGTRTEGVVASLDGAEVWTGSMQGGDIVGIHGATGDTLAVFRGLQVPFRLGITPDGKTVVVSDPGGHVVALIDRVAREMVAKVDVAGAAVAAGLGAEPSPQGFTLSADGAFAFVSAKGIDRIAVVDLAAREVVRFLPSGAAPDGIGFSPLRPTEVLSR